MRYIVQKVRRQDLNRQHGQKRKERASPNYAEHVPEVRARRHLDVLGDVHCAVYRNADIGCLEGGRVIDSVAQEADDVTGFTERVGASKRADDPLFVRGGQPSEYADGIGGSRQFALAHRLDFSPEKDAIDG